MCFPLLFAGGHSLRHVKGCFWRRHGKRSRLAHRDRPAHVQARATTVLLQHVLVYRGSGRARTYACVKCGTYENALGLRATALERSIRFRRLRGRKLLLIRCVCAHFRLSSIVASLPQDVLEILPILCGGLKKRKNLDDDMLR